MTPKRYIYHVYLPCLFTMFIYHVYLPCLQPSFYYINDIRLYIRNNFVDISLCPASSLSCFVRSGISEVWNLRSLSNVLRLADTKQTAIYLKTTRKQKHTI